MVTFDDMARMEKHKDVHGLIQALSERDEKVRGEIVFALMRLGDKYAIEPLVHIALKDSDDYVREFAATALHEFGNKRAIEPLIDVLKHNDGEVRENAEIALEICADFDLDDYLEKFETANKYENALRYEDAAKLYDELELWDDAGRLRKLKEEKERSESITQTPTTIHIEKVESLKNISGSKILDDHSMKISNSVVHRSTISTDEPINNCPFCGKKFSFKKTPKFCPYCNEELR